MNNNISVIFQGKMSNICWFQLPECKDLLIVGWTNETIRMFTLGSWKI